jgi:hypothetical protein
MKCKSGKIVKRGHNYLIAEVGPIIGEADQI